MFERLYVTLQILRGDVAARFEREEGATAVEYGLMVALIAAVIIGAVIVIGQQLASPSRTWVTGSRASTLRPPPDPFSHGRCDAMGCRTSHRGWARRR